LKGQELQVFQWQFQRYSYELYKMIA
jgi:hypothetical protein